MKTGDLIVVAIALAAVYLALRYRASQAGAELADDTRLPGGQWIGLQLLRRPD